MQLASKTKGQKDDVTVIVIDAMPSEDMRMPPALQQKKSTSTMIARYCSCQAWCSRLWIMLIKYWLPCASRQGRWCTSQSTLFIRMSQ